MAAAAVFDQAKDCRAPKTTHDPDANEVFPYEMAQAGAFVIVDSTSHVAIERELVKLEIALRCKPGRFRITRTATHRAA